MSAFRMLLLAKYFLIKKSCKVNIARTLYSALECENPFK